MAECMSKSAPAELCDFANNADVATLQFLVVRRTPVTVKCVLCTRCDDEAMHISAVYILQM
jgi:hypothetical protein